MKLYIQLFLVAALGYGGVAGLLLNNPLIGVLFGVGMGVVLAAIFGTLQHQAFEGKKQGAEHNVHQIRELELDMPYADAYGLCIEAIATLGGISIKQSSRLEGVIEARTHLNWQTYGERISVQLVRLDEDSTRVRIESRPRIKAALTDFGRNLHNINRLTVFLRKHSGSDALNPRLETLDEAPLNDDDYPFMEALLPAKR